MKNLLKYRRAMAAMLTVALLCSFAFISLAAEAPVISVGSATTEPGGTVSVDVTISGSTGLSNFDLQIDAGEGLHLVSVSNKDCLCTGLFLANTEDRVVCWASATDVTSASGTLFRLTFQADASAKAGRYEIGVGVKQGGALSSTKGAVAASFSRGSVTIEDAKRTDGSTGGTTSGNTGSNRGDIIEIDDEMEKLPDAPETSLFYDVSANAWYAQCVNDLARAGVIGGYPDGSFRPNRNVTAAEALKLILLASGYEVNASSNGHWAHPYLDFALANGIVSTAPALDEPVTRVTVAGILARARKIAPDAVSKPFSDTNDPYAAALQQAGLMEGYPDGSFGPDRTLTRAELSMLLWRMNQTEQ